MKRVIKFRGKRLGNGEWVYGDLLHINGGCLIYYGSQTKCELIEGKSDIAVEMGMDEIAPVDPDTVGQFTGLLDANGKEIYEGDILGVKGKVFGWVKCDVCNYCYYSIVYVDNSMGINEWSLYGIVKDDYPKQIEVIGNIHDNPGLLKGGKK